MYQYGGTNINPADYLTVQFLTDLQHVRMITWAGFVVLVYDYMLTFDNELCYIWQARPSVVKTLFLANRYGNLILVAVLGAQAAGTLRSNDDPFCLIFSLVSSIFSFLSYASIHILVLLRAWAVWERQKIFFVLLGSGFFIYAVVSITILIIGILLAGIWAYPTSPFIGTCVSHIPSWGWILWLPSALLELGVFSLTMYNLKKYRMGIKGYMSPIVRVLIRDGTIYFLFVTFSNILKIAIWTEYYQDPYNMITTFTLSLVSVIGQRLVIDLRQIGRDGFLPQANGFSEFNMVPGGGPPALSTVIFELGAVSNGTVQSVLEAAAQRSMELPKNQEPAGEEEGSITLAHDSHTVIWDCNCS